MSSLLYFLMELSVASAIFYGIYHLSMKIFKKRITKQCRYFLCLLVVFRMLIPFGVNIEIPWDSVSERIFGPAPEKAADVVAFREDIPESGDDAAVSDIPTQEFMAEGTNDKMVSGVQVVKAESDKWLSTDSETVSDSGESSKLFSLLAHIGRSLDANISDHWEIILFSIWGIGAAICFAYYELGYLRWEKLLLKECRPAEMADDELLEQMYPKGYVELLQSDQVSTPLLCGALCPYIILPEGGFVGNRKQSMLEHILRHEMYHVRRKDLIWKHLAILGRSIHWFNPFLHSVCDELSRCCELSCDEAVTRNMDKNSAKAYGETILMLASDASSRTPALVNGFCHEKEELKERLEGIMNHRKLSGRMVALSLVLVLVMSGCGTVLAPDQGVLADTMGEVIAEVEEPAAGEEAAEAVGEGSDGEAVESEAEAGILAGETEAAEGQEQSVGEPETEQAAEATEAAEEPVSGIEEPEAAEEKHPLLLSDVVREIKTRPSWDGKSTIYDAFDTMYIMAAGQETKLYVKDSQNMHNPSETPTYDINEFVTLAAHALNHLYEVSGYRSDHWNVYWSTLLERHGLSFGLSDFAKCEEFYWIDYSNGYSEAVLGEEVSDNQISNIGFVFSETRDYSPLSWKDMKKPENLKSMSMEEAARWYYENYLVYDAGEVEQVLITDANMGGKGKEVEVYTADGEAFYIHVMDDNSFTSIYGPYPERSLNHWINPPEGLENTFEEDPFA